MSGQIDNPPTPTSSTQATASATPLFIDTGAFYARMDEDDAHHARATAVFNAIQAGDLPYRPLYTTSYVLTELVTLGLARANYALAATALRRVRASPSVTVLHPDEPSFAATCNEFYRYDDQEISLVDHATGVLADDRDVEHVFTFDPDDFRTLGFTVVPDDTGEV
jgi:predicted nucleic acid-binding protein